MLEEQRVANLPASGAVKRSFLLSISGASRHIVRAQRCTSSDSANDMGHLRTSRSFLASPEMDDVVAIRPFSAPSKMHVSPERLHRLDAYHVLIALALNEHHRWTSLRLPIGPDSNIDSAVFRAFA